MAGLDVSLFRLLSSSPPPDIEGVVFRSNSCVEVEVYRLDRQGCVLWEKMKFRGFGGDRTSSAELKTVRDGGYWPIYDTSET